MDFVEPTKLHFTIYSKKECNYCKKVKTLLDEYEFFYTIINCDEYLVEHREQFIQFIKSNAGANAEIKSFPIVFHEGIYVGNYFDTIKYIDTYLSFF